jgi:hypothetical protein
MRRNNILLLALVAGIVALVGFAWIDGGREPVHAIVEPVPVPGAVR